MRWSSPETVFDNYLKQVTMPFKLVSWAGCVLGRFPVDFSLLTLDVSVLVCFFTSRWFSDIPFSSFSSNI